MKFTTQQLRNNFEGSLAEKQEQFSSKNHWMELCVLDGIFASCLYQWEKIGNAPEFKKQLSYVNEIK